MRTADEKMADWPVTYAVVYGMQTYADNDARKLETRYNWAPSWKPLPEGAFVAAMLSGWPKVGSRPASHNEIVDRKTTYFHPGNVDREAFIDTMVYARKYVRGELVL